MPVIQVFQIKKKSSKKRVSKVVVTCCSCSFCTIFQFLLMLMLMRMLMLVLQAGDKPKHAVVRGVAVMVAAESGKLAKKTVSKIN